MKKIEHLLTRMLKGQFKTIRQIYAPFIQASKTGTSIKCPAKPHRPENWHGRYHLFENQSPYNQSIVDNAGRLKNALGIIENHFSIGALFGAFDNLLKVWDTKNAELLRTFVRKHLTNYNGRRKFVQKLKFNVAWYCNEDGASRLPQPARLKKRKNP